jgi:hypothetical protein
MGAEGHMTKSSGKFDLEAAKSNPSRFFDRPDDVVRLPDLTNDQKIAILRQWETDARLMSVAEEENMPGDQPVPLDDILKAIEALTKSTDTDAASGGGSASKLGV